MSGGSRAAVLVTGANGFVGRHVCDELARRQRPFRMLVRTGVPTPTGGTVFDASGLFDEEVLRPALNGCSAVIHLAARVHVMEDRATDPLAEFRRINVDATRLLARCALDEGVERFVFVSSAKVNGESTSGAAFRESDPPAPEDAYGRSKLEAEQALQEIATETGLEVVILRPPLMYGAGVKANLLRLMRLIQRGVPLPLGATNNRRSLAFVRNVADAAVIVADHPRAAGETFLLGDVTLSSAELVRQLATALGRQPRLLRVPPAVIRTAGVLSGKKAAVNRLLGSLEVDSRKIRNSLGWQPPYSVDKGLQETADWFLASERAHESTVP